MNKLFAVILFFNSVVYCCFDVKAEEQYQSQYASDILNMEDALSVGDLESADFYGKKLEKWTWKHADMAIPLDDELRIRLDLALCSCRKGDLIKSRIQVDNAWKRLEEENAIPSLIQLIDRHIVERELRMDSLGRSRINAEWLIETSTPIIEAGIEDAGILAFFYESRAWAYEGLQAYDNAISNIEQAIALNPLDSRKKKLAHFYLAKKEFALAEKELLDLYNSSSISKVLNRSVMFDLASLYWLWGDKKKLSRLMTLDFEEMKSEIREAFPFMNEDEREQYLSQTLLGSTIKYDFYTGFSDVYNQWAEGNQCAYDLALVQKGLLLSTTKDIEHLIQSAPDSLQTVVKNYNTLKELDIPGVESSITRDFRLKIMEYVAAHPSFLSQLNYTWEQVRNRLRENEVAIEFIPLRGVTPDNIDTANPATGALIIRKDASYPIFVRLFSDSIVEALFEYAEDDRMDDLFYKDNAKVKLYEAIWKPLIPYLDGVNTIYYSPTGILQTLNVDLLGDNDDKLFGEKFDLFRLSSTRELCLRKSNDYINDAALYGDITYAISDSVSENISPQRYRSITRAGFGSLTGTKSELDSIMNILSPNNYSVQEFRRMIATEESFRCLSGKAPKILHIATHGFYYSNEAVKQEFQKGNFIGFQAMRPELFHSGLAMAGAQDTWTNKNNGDSINFEKYYDLDPKSDGVLLSAEISDMDLSGADLVVLSACQTALGKVTSEGVYGLQRAFKLAGVNSIVMSLWKVDDDATRLFMKYFYQNLLNGKSKRESLLAAQKAVRDTPGYADPYYWAAFVLLDGLN